MAKYRDDEMPVHVSDEDFICLSQWTWKVSQNGYVFRNTSVRKRGRKNPWNYRVWMHRQIMHLNWKHRRVVDHKDGSGLNNCRTKCTNPGIGGQCGNLQVVSQSKNMRLAFQRRLEKLNARRMGAATA